MSYRDPGALPTPPPLPRRRSPWLLAAVGCGTLSVAAFGFLAVLGYNISAEMKKPLDVAALRNEFRDVPQYPGAKLDEDMTKAQRGGGALSRMLTGELKADKTVVGAWMTKEPPSEVKFWYDQVMRPRGYQSVPQPEIGDALSMFYRNGRDGVLVVAQRAPQENGMTIIVLQKLTGMHSDFGEDAMAPPTPAGTKPMTPVGEGAVGTSVGAREKPIQNVTATVKDASGKPVGEKK